MPVPAPRPAERAIETLNDRLVDLQTRNAFYQESLQNREAADIAEALSKKVFRPTEFKLEEGLRRIRSTPGRPNKTQRQAVEALAKRINRQVERGFSGVVGKAKNSIFQTATTEADLQAKVLKRMLPKGLELRMPTKRTLRTISYQQRVQGRTLNEWFDKLKRDSAAEIRAAVRQGVANGTGARRIAQSIRGTKAAAFRNGINAKYQRYAQTIVRTAQNQAMNDARLAYYEANQDKVAGYQWNSILDNRTSDVCLSLDGRVFQFGRGPEPPAHFLCRSSVSPVFKEWRKLGLKSSQLTNSEKKELNGKPAKKQTSFQWLRKQPLEAQEEALGKTRASMLRQGRLNENTIVDRNGRSRTLSELRKLQAKQR